MGDVFKAIFAALVAAGFTFCIAGLVVAALGWPFFIAGVFTGAGGGAAAVRAWQRAKAHNRPAAPDA